MARRRSSMALTDERRIDQLIADAYDLAERQIQNGTASAQVLSYFLREGSIKTKLENEKLKRENELLRAKTESLEAQKSSAELYEEALKAFSRYSGYSVDDDVETLDI